jgi:aspartyl-tRNA(Asn)/glutamyl-tRNA(Gln) amidotransferase subunit B
MSDYRTTIGLEVHAELATKSKMFCGCLNAPHESEPNANICPVCTGQPGTLPVPNHAAIKSVLLFGEAIGATQADYSEFDRKNYFYPDIPKAYQISQYKYPLLTGGAINGVELTRVHLEEDTARSSHEHTDGSLVDFNRAGVPLMELVTEPVIHSAAQAGAFARELQLILQTIGISHANMERGEMRIEANISVSKTDEFGTKVEVKNINSFKAVEAAIDFEVTRQIAALEAGEELVQETRGWNENTEKTFSQRSKETAKDYRYFPDPDIPKFKLSEIEEFTPTALRASLPVLPAEKRKILRDLDITGDVQDTLVSQLSLGALFFGVHDTHADQPELLGLIANYIAGDINKLAKDTPEYLDRLDVAKLVELFMLNQDGVLGSKAVKQLLPILPDIDGTVLAYAEEKRLVQITDEAALRNIATEIVAENPDQVAEYKAGKDALIKFLVGQGMKKTGGSAHPELLEASIKSVIADTL